MYATDLTPAQKAARTRLAKKAEQAYEEMIAPEYTQWVEALDRLCPPRDAVIEALQKSRDEAIAKIEADYQKGYDAVMESYNNLMKPTQDALDQARDKAWEMHKNAMLRKN
jgi:predicted P-loop ATPase/GTPase